MHRRLVIAAAALMFAAPGLSEPAKTPATDPAHPAARPVEVVLASAEQVRSPAATADETAAPVKRPRVARVTTCRCADQQAQEQQ